MNRILIAAAIVIVLIIGAFYVMKGKSPASGADGSGQAAETQSIKLYYYDEENDRDESGTILCSAAGLVAVERTIPSSQIPLTEAIELLLKGALTPDEEARGITTEFPLEGVTLKRVSIEDGAATLTFDDPLHKTSGGSCRASILSAQIEATAKQFPTVQEVRLMPEELFQP